MEYKLNIKRSIGLVLLVAGILGTLLFPAQSQFEYIYLGVSISFFGYTFLTPFFQHDRSFMFFVGVSFFIQGCIIFIFPNLSNDLYRFVWDGLLWHDGIHPFLHTPEQVLEFDLFSSDKAYYLFDKMNSQGYYSIYPPVCQGVFFLGTFSKSVVQSVWLIKGLFFLFNVLTAYYLVNTLKFLGLPKGYSLYYLLNPLVLIELIGNLHFESIMITFLAGFLYYLVRSKYVLAGVSLSLSVATKLVPLLFVPAIFFYLRKQTKSLIALFSACLLSLLIMFIPLFYSTFSNLMSSIDLYFQSFEFNASIYYLLRSLFFKIYGYNQIAILGPSLGLLACLFIIGLAFKNKESHVLGLIKVMTFSFILYLILATTIHPWYLASILLLNCFLRYQFIWVWSFLIFLSYSAYDTQPFQEHTLFLVLEYGIVLFVFLYEFGFLKRFKNGGLVTNQ